MAVEIDWAEITIGKTTKRYTMGTDAETMGFDPTTGAFLVTDMFGNITSHWNVPIVIRHKEVPDIVVPEIVMPEDAK